MARRKQKARSGRRRSLSLPSPIATYIVKIVDVARTWLSQRYVLIGLEIAVLLMIAAAGFALRMIPWDRVNNLLELPIFTRVPADLKQFGYLYGNDPWIEYWQAKYLYEHGLGSWLKLTRDNPATHVFWWPWGRDFTSSSYPFVPALAAATYSLVSDTLSLQQWIALIPPIMSLVMLAAGYLYMRILFGRVAALVTIPLLYLVPATLDRTHAGFVEKEGISLGFFILALMLLSIALRRRSLAWAAAAGLATGLVGFMWGGYRLLILVFAAAIMLTPLASRGIDDMKKLSHVGLAAAVSASATLALASSLSAVQLTISILPLAAGLATMLLVYLLPKLLVRVYGPAYEAKIFKTYGFAVIAVGIAAILLLPMTGIGGRALYTILWPLRGLVNLGPLVESIAEHAPLLASPASAERINILLVTGFIGGIVALLYHGFKRKMPEALPAAVAALSTLYGVIGMVYLLQVASVMAALVTPAILEPLLGKRPSRGYTVFTDELRKGLLIVLVLALLASALYNARIALGDVQARVPGILTANGPTLNPGWLVLLDYLRAQTDNTTIVVTWWDYGYWVSVGAGNPTLADGATINGTQISILARMLVSDEDTSSKIMEEFGLEPGKTLILVHDAALYLNGNVYFLNMIDLPKSYWMVRIGGYDPRDYFATRIVGGRPITTPSPALNGTRNGLLYNILVDAAYRLASNRTNIIAEPKPGPVVSVYLAPPGVATEDDRFQRPLLRHFQPRIIIAYGTPIATTQGTGILYTIIALYEWTG